MTSRQLQEAPSLTNEVPVTTSGQLHEAPGLPKGGAATADTQVQWCAATSTCTAIFPIMLLVLEVWQIRGTFSIAAS